MNKSFFVIVILLTISVFTFLIRVYKLESLPVGVHPDEASWGYNAFSILKTGKDEHGITFPLIFKAFGDNKLPIYTYSIIPGILVFGLSNTAVRLPAVIAGTVLVIVLYFLLRELKFSRTLSLLGALITSLSPWSMMLSRVFGYDSLFGLLFFTIGLYFFLKDQNSAKHKNIFCILTAIFFGLSWYTYVAYRMISTAAVFFLGMLYYRLNKRLLVIMVLVYVAVIAPLLAWRGGFSRFGQVVYTPMKGITLSIDENRYWCTRSLPKTVCYLQHNKATYFSYTLIKRFIMVFSPLYLFIEGDKSSIYINVDHYGLHYLFLLPFFYVGMFYLFKKIMKGDKNVTVFLVTILLCISPLASVLVDEPQKVRLSPFFPFTVIVMLYGINTFIVFIRSFFIRRIIVIVLFIWLFISGLFFLFDFYVIHLRKNEYYYQSYVANLYKSMKAIGTNATWYIKGIDEGIMFYAYFDKYDPEKFQKNAVRETPDHIGFAHVQSLDTIHLTDKSIEDVYCLTKEKQHPVYYVSNEDYVSQGKINKAVKTIFSENKALKFLFIYDVKRLKNKEYVCAQK